MKVRLFCRVSEGCESACECQDEFLCRYLPSYTHTDAVRQSHNNMTCYSLCAGFLCIEEEKQADHLPAPLAPHTHARRCLDWRKVPTR
jgi:hypothetical protein